MEELTNSVAIIVDGSFKAWYHASHLEAARTWAEGAVAGGAYGGVDLWAVVWADESDDLRSESQKAYDEAVAAYRKEKEDQDAGEG